MTREEAKQIISDIDKAYRNYTADEYKALEMAIQALSQEPCDDAISRDAVLDALLDYWHDIQFVDGSGYDVYEDCKAVIDELPSVTQKSGKWEDLHRCWVCSECGQETHIEHKYCPNCGAKMESEE